MTISFLIFFGSFWLFLFNIQHPKTHNFDEFHYVPAAKQYLAGELVQNLEHPPLGKELMAIGIGLFGDQPLGWRIMSVLFGSLTLVGFYFLSLILFQEEKVALWACALSAFNGLLYVQSRIGMLDTLMFGFITWALVFFCNLWSPKLRKIDLEFSFFACGIFLGLAISVKWFAVVSWGACVGLVLLVLLLQKWEVRLGHPKKTDWFRPKLWQEVSGVKIGLALFVVPFVVYYLSFIPVFLTHGKFLPYDFIELQAYMYNQQLRVASSHPYMSSWLEWAILKRPIWYAFNKEGPDEGMVRGVILLGNPMMMWLGLFALLSCLKDVLLKRSQTAFFIFYFYSAFLFCWIFIPRKVSFYYYYYPAGMILTLALAHLFWERLKGARYEKFFQWAYLGACAGMFFHFFPLYAALKIPAESFRRWMWFTNWI